MNIVNLEKKDLKDINNIIQKCFGVNVDYDENKMHLGIMLGKKLVSYVSLLFFEIKIKNKIYKIMGICALSTLPEFRGKGYASKLIQKSIEWAKNNDINFIILYGEADFYSKLGFVKIPSLYEKNNAMVYIINDELKIFFNKSNIEAWKNIPKF
jgi:predicted N-acetyltransferase YhbS